MFFSFVSIIIGWETKLYLLKNHETTYWNASRVELCYTCAGNVIEISRIERKLKLEKISQTTQKGI